LSKSLSDNDHIGGFNKLKVTRRDFIKFCGISAAAIGLSATDIGLLEQALANPSAPSVIWLQGASCTGCSVSFLNRISSSAPYTSADVLISSINLVYHPNIMSAAGDLAVSMAEEAYNNGNYVLVVEGGVPTAFDGACCWPWSYNGVDVTFQEAVTGLASKAAAILCVGTCASFGGIPASGNNPTAIKSVSALTGKKTINIAGCPAHPDWIVYAVAQLLMGNSIPLDTNGRPTALFSKTVHDKCPRRETDETETFGVDNRCLKELGCRGPETRGNCPVVKWNNGMNWCVDANAPCIGCTEPTFPGTNAFYQSGGDD
jgi:hydrogenase small subunit